MINNETDVKASSDARYFLGRINAQDTVSLCLRLRLPFLPESSVNTGSTSSLPERGGRGRARWFSLIATSATPSSDPHTDGTQSSGTLLVIQQHPRHPLPNTCSADFRENKELLLMIVDSHCALLQDMHDDHLYSHINLKTALYNSNMM